MTDVAQQIASFGAEALVIAGVVWTAVEAIRKRIAFDGWKVVAVASAVCLVICALLFAPWAQPDWAEALRHAGIVFVLALGGAVGGDAGVRKIAKSTRTINANFTGK